MRFIEDHFNTLLATAIFVGLCVMAMHAFHHGEVDFSAFATDQAKTFGGALLMALTGRALMNGKPKDSGTGAPKAPETTAPAVEETK